MVSPFEEFYKRLKHERYCDILIDRSAASNLGDDYALWQSADESMPLQDAFFDATPEISPLLLRVTLKDANLIENLLERAQSEALDTGGARTVCAFLFNQVTLPRLSQHLSFYLKAYMEGFGAIYYRYFDPRVWPHLQHIATPDQMHELFGHVTAWLAMDWQGRLQTYAPPPVSGPYAKRYSRGYSAEQWQQIERIETVNLALQCLRRSGNPIPEITRATETVARAAAHLESQADQVAYSAYALTHGTAFTQHREIDKVLQLAREHDIPLSDAIEDRLQLMLEAATLKPAPTLNQN